MSPHFVDHGLFELIRPREAEILEVRSPRWPAFSGIFMLYRSVFCVSFQSSRPSWTTDSGRKVRLILWLFSPETFLDKRISDLSMDNETPEYLLRPTAPARYILFTDLFFPEKCRNRRRRNKNEICPNAQIGDKNRRSVLVVSPIFAENKLSPKLSHIAEK
jgi:hypothetical protein